jgi:hypothetical protein
MKPSDAELKDLLQSAQWIDLKEDSHGVELSMRQAETAMQLAKAELQRRQQPASVTAEIAKVQPCGCVVCTCEDELPEVEECALCKGGKGFGEKYGGAIGSNPIPCPRCNETGKEPTKGRKHQICNDQMHKE